MEIWLVLIAAVLAAWIILVWIRDTNRFVTVEYTIADDKITKPYTFALLSDLHNKRYGNGNGKLAAAVNNLNIDSIVVAGDMYTSREGAGYDNALALFQKVSGRCPIYYAHGNHEHKTKLYPEFYGQKHKEYTKELQKLGVEFLVNEHIRLPEYNINLCGSEIGREYYKRFAPKQLAEGYLEELLGESQKDACQILIAHNPDYFKEYGEWGADVVLSGHVHGGVVRLPQLGGVIAPSLRLFPKYDGGLFRENGCSMVLSRGLGMHTIPVRVWNPGELVVVHIVPKS